MKTSKTNIRFNLASIFVALTFTFIFLPQSLFAAQTGAGATIFNKVTVKYKFNAGAEKEDFATATVNVVTVAAVPTISAPADGSTTEGGTVIYTYTVTNNANGPDTFVVTKSTVDANVTAPVSTTLSTASIALWGNMALGSGAGYIELPGGFLTTNLAVGDKINIGGNLYTVDDNGSGAAKYDAGSAQTSIASEVPGKLYLTNVGAAPALIVGTVGAGTQVGEYVTNLTMTIVAGSLNAALGPYTHTTDVKVESTATGTDNVTKASATDTVVTNVTAADFVTITKTASPASDVKPGQIITYTITVENTHATLPLTGMYIIDPIPAYTTLVTAGTPVTINYPIGTSNSYTTGDNGDKAYYDGTSLYVTFGTGSGDAKTPVGGTLPATVDGTDDKAIITFQVTVD